MSSLSTKERKAKLNTDDLIFRKKSKLSSYVDIEYNSAESLTNKYKLLGTKSKRAINSLASSKKYIMIEEFKDELKDLKNILNEIKILEPLRKQEINEIKNKTKRKLNVLDDEINDISEKLDVNLATIKLRCIFCRKPYNLKKEKELRLSAKENMNKIEGVKKKLNY